MTLTTTFLLLWLLFAPPPPASLDQVKAEPNAERRARLAIDFAVTSEKNAEAAYAKGDLEATGTQLKIMAESMELAKTSLAASGRTPGRNPAPYKYAEQRSQETLIRLRDLDQRMEADERDILAAPRSRVQEIHDEWFEGIMERKK
ncbi:MAG TPA: hypothetical protein VEF06_11870 [Bryobacteraceae bacterium]|nr:hypothetical protein [Bryobacteraceae bacterium]